MPKDITFLAKTNFRKEDQKFGIKRNDRRQHMYVVGKTGVGKTAFLRNMALQDINNGEGLAIIDPHGEFVEEVLDCIPPERIKDVVYFNPADTEFPVSFNVLEVNDPQYKHLVASGLIGIFTKIWANVWSARMEYILANCILALLDTPGTTLLGIPRMLVDRDYRQKIINNLKDPVVKSFWINEYEEWSATYRNEAIAPVQNKVGQFLNVSLVRNIVGQAKNTIDIDDIMNSGKILLVNVSKGRIGEDNAAILGAMIITKIQLSAMERVRIPEAERKDFYLYVDEFQNFATDSFVHILSEARKYRLNLIVAHQYIGQLVTETTTAVRDAVFGNVGTIVCFRVGAADAEFLEQEFTPEFLQDDLVNLPNYNIYLKLMIDGIASRPFSSRTIAPAGAEFEKASRSEIIKISRQQYSKTKVEAEGEITRWAGNLEMQDSMINTLRRSQVQVGNAGGTLYDATCSNCGKPTKTIFKPEEGRPVYCKSCLKKIKAEAPLVASSGTSPRPSKKPNHTADLEKIGIEFGSPKITQQRYKDDRSSVKPAEKPRNQNTIEKNEKVEKVEKIENIAFSARRERVERSVPQKSAPKRKEINLAELKKVLAESLSTAEKEKATEKEAAAAVSRTESSLTNQKEVDAPVVTIALSKDVVQEEKNLVDAPVHFKEEKAEKAEDVLPATKKEDKNREDDGNKQKGIIDPGQRVKL